jgi:hypothetical protein
MGSSPARAPCQKRRLPLPRLSVGARLSMSACSSTIGPRDALTNRVVSFLSASSTPPTFRGLQNIEVGPQSQQTASRRRYSSFSDLHVPHQKSPVRCRFAAMTSRASRGRWRTTCRRGTFSIARIAARPWSVQFEPRRAGFTALLSGLMLANDEL